MDSITKICTRCKQEKPIENFGNKAYECNECRNKRTREYKASHPEKASEYRRRYKENNPESFRAAKKRGAKLYRERHPEKVRELKRESAKRNRDTERAWRRNNEDKVAASRRKWCELHPEQKAASSRNVRAQRKGAEGTHTPEEWRELCERYDNKCLCCNEVKPLTVDHVIPLSKGGTNYIDNIQPLCKSCNCRKSTKTIDYRCKMTS